MKVLVAEDNLTMRQMMGILLSRRDIPCSLAEDGQEAVEVWEHGDFGIILMDVQMPKVDGLEATRMIREKEKARGGHVVIIAMTAHTMAEDKEQCFEAGMDDYISKPVVFDELLSLIDKYR